MRWPCDDERQRRQHRHTAFSPPDIRTSRRSRAECCRRAPGSAEPQQHGALQSAQLYRPVSLDVNAAAHHHRTSEQRGSSIHAASETFGSKRRACVLASTRASTSASVIELRRVLRGYARPYSWPAISPLLHQRGSLQPVRSLWQSLSQHPHRRARRHPRTRTST